MTFGDLIGELSIPDCARGMLTAAEYHALDPKVPSEKSVRDREKDGGYFVACTLTNDGRRCNENVIELTGIALDFDNGHTSRTDIIEQLNGHAYIAYSTYSYLPDLEKWRVFIPYRQQATIAQHGAAYGHFQQLFRGDIDPHCRTPSQFSYMPSCPPDASETFQSFYGLGELFDPAAQLDEDTSVGGTSAGDAEKVGRSGVGADVERLEAALAVISSDDRKTWIEFGMAIKHDLGQTGLSTWLAWSGKSPKFDLDDALKSWASFKEQTPGAKITLGTIFYMAQERGWIDGGAGEAPEYVTRLNKNHFLAPQGGKTQIFREGFHPLDGRTTLQSMGLADFRAPFMNEFIEVFDGRGKAKRIPVGEAWLTHAQHRQYEGVLLAPNRDVGSFYNTWRGFSVEPCPGSWALIYKHVHEILCAGDRAISEYLINWLARCVQRPGEQGEVAIVFRGGRGTGKGMFVRAFGKIYGQHFAHISQARHLTGNFNAHLGDCIVLFVDEGFWAGDKQGEAVLKHLITEPTIPIERKGVDMEMMANMLHVIIASNSQWVVPAGLDERRYLVVDVDSAKQQDPAYFKALSDEIENGGVAAMLNELLQRDITLFNHRKVPSTKALVEQKLLSLDPTQQWYLEKLQSGSLTGRGGEWELVLRPRVQADYVACLKDAGSSRRATQTELGMRLRGLLPKPYPQSIEATVRIDNIPVRGPCYRLPALKVCRNHFETLVGLQGYDWPEEDPAA